MEATVNGSKSESLSTSNEDKEKLTHALNFQCQTSSFEFARRTQLERNVFGINSIQVYKFGSIAVPVSRKELRYLELISENSLIGIGLNLTYDPTMMRAREINPSRILFTASDFAPLKSLILKNLQFPTELSMIVDLRLEKMALYDNGCFFHERCGYESKGFIGKAFLQLPVEGDHRGGRLSVRYQNRVASFETSEESHQNCHLTTFYKGCRYSMDPIVAGFKLSLIFNVVWKKEVTEPPSDLPSFISSYKAVKEYLSKCIPRKTTLNNTLIDDIDHLDEVCYNSPIDEVECENEELKQIRQFIVSSSEKEKQKMPENVFYVALEEQYALEELSFRGLRGNDRDLAFLLKSCRFLDLHLLAGISRVVKAVCLKEIECFDCDDSEQDCSQCIETIPGAKTKLNYFGNVRWIDSNDVDVHFDIQSLDGRNIGPNFESLSNKWEQPDRPVVITKTKTPDGKFLVEKCYHYRHNVFVIWPKCQSTSIYFCHGIHSLVNRWEESTSDPSRLLTDQELGQLRRGVARAVTLLGDATLRDWSERVMAKENFATRLLRLCISLKAKEEGLSILKLLAELEFGIFNEEIAESISEFVIRIAGWGDSSEHIRSLIKQDRFRQRYFPMIHLASSFFYVNCIEGVTMIAKLLSANSKFIAKLQDVGQIQREENDPVMDFVILLEQDGRTSSHDRLKSFVTHYYSGLSTSRRIKLLMEVETNRDNRMSAATRQTLLEKMTLILSTCQPSDIDFSYTDVMELLSFFVRQRNSKCLSSFTARVSQPPADSNDNRHYDSMIDSLIEHKSDDILELAAILKDVKSCFSSLLVHRVPIMLKEVLSSEELNRSSLNTMLSSHLKFYKQLIQGNAPPAETDLVTITHFLSDLRTDQQLRLILEIYEFNSSALNQDAGVIRYLRQMVHNLHVTVHLQPNEIPFAQFDLETLKCFVALGNHYIVVFMDSFLRAQVGTAELRVSKHRLFELVLTDVLVLLDEADKLEVLDICGEHLADLVKEVERKTNVVSLNPCAENYLTVCLRFFILLETSDITANHAATAFKLQIISCKLRTRVLLETILNIHQLQVTCDIKQLPTCFAIFRGMCRFYFMSDFIVTGCKNDCTLTEVLRCLLWLNDDHCWQSLANGICQSFSTDIVTPFADVVQKSFQELFLDSPSALKAYDNIVDCAQHQINMSSDSNLNQTGHRGKVSSLVHAFEFKQLIETRSQMSAIMKRRRLAAAKEGNFGRVVLVSSPKQPKLD